MRAGSADGSASAERAYCWMAAELLQIDEIEALLRECRTIAVLGAHWQPSRPAFYVPDYLHRVGYRILPINPRLVDRALWGQPVRASLSELEERVDLVDVFRPSRALPGHLEELLGMRPRPRAVWFQSGIRHDAVAAALIEGGIEIVQDRCTYADHRNLAIPRLDDASR
ncbi:MAG: CoA-binding protein [Myxococcales bacterium]|nr:CoA-binding protein [Myxococcales bacterium]